MAENNKKQENPQELPKPQSMKKQNKKMSILLYAVIVLCLLGSVTGSDGVFVIASILGIILAIVYLVVFFKNRPKGK